MLENSPLNTYGTFFLYGSIVCFAMPIVYFVLPETKNISLELVQNYFVPKKTVFYIDIYSGVEKTRKDIC